MPAAQRGRSCWPPKKYIIAAEPVVRVASDAPVTLSRPDDVLPLSAADPARVVALAEEYGVVSSIGRLQKALDKLLTCECPRYGVSRALDGWAGLLRATDLVGAVVVLERHGDLTLGCRRC